MFASPELQAQNSIIISNHKNGGLLKVGLKFGQLTNIIYKSQNFGIQKLIYL